jgi:hypothetical protein
LEQITRSTTHKPHQTSLSQLPQPWAAATVMQLRSWRPSTCTHVRGGSNVSSLTQHVMHADGGSRAAAASWWRAPQPSGAVAPSTQQRARSRMAAAAAAASNTPAAPGAAATPAVGADGGGGGGSSSSTPRQGPQGPPGERKSDQQHQGSNNSSDRGAGHSSSASTQQTGAGGGGSDNRKQQPSTQQQSPGGHAGGKRPGHGLPAAPAPAVGVVPWSASVAGVHFGLSKTMKQEYKAAGEVVCVPAIAMWCMRARLQLLPQPWAARTRTSHTPAGHRHYTQLHTYTRVHTRAHVHT